MVIGRAGYVAGGIIMNQLKPRMLNADGWNWGEFSESTLTAKTNA